jgi:phosphatidylinositol alpha-1,6-mannosyltransferase
MARDASAARRADRRSSSLKSLLISNVYFPPQVGGISEMMAALFEHLGPAQVCCLTGVARTEARQDIGRVYRRPAAFRLPRWRQALPWGVALAEILARERPRAVQIAIVDDGHLGVWLKRWLHLPFLVYAHGNDILRVLQGVWPGQRAALQAADRVVANSRFTAGLLEQAGVNPRRVHVIHPGCDAERFCPRDADPVLRERLLGARARGPILLTVGNLVERKGHDVVIQALPQVIRRAPHATYLIVGDGPHRNQLDHLARAAGVRDHIVFAGRVGADDLPAVYALSDVFVMPSRVRPAECDVEGFGLVFLEANACGKPVIGGRAGGIPDAIVDGETGFLVDPASPAAIGERLLTVLADRERATEMGQRGRSRVQTDFSWTRAATQVQELITTMVTAPNAPAGELPGQPR